ncbi:MAG: hypothetical protein B6U72_03660 [Candidatus Altiarchaeales archaeon ex4484_2]|nr:MAG: hypothetical protein B6U72_03660 [Candidatus Altiarchaeales archaeon ex4484_2]
MADKKNQMIMVDSFLKKKKNLEEINRIGELYPERKSLFIDYDELERYNNELADEIIQNPDRLIKIFNNTLKERVTINPELIDDPHFHDEDPRMYVRFYNLPRQEKYTILVREITSDYVGKLISVEGVINKQSDVLPKVRVGRFVCNKCDTLHDEPQNTRFLRPPIYCESCKKRDFRFVPDESKWTDIQKLEIQEPLEMLKGGEQARRIEIWVEDDLTDTGKPGDKVVITGIVRLLPPKQNSSVYFKYVEANNIERIEKEFEEVDIEDDEIKLIKKLAKDPRIYDSIIHSIAPGIYGYNEVKEAIALQLFGGRRHKRMPDGTMLRPDIHLLLIGDPGVAKSRILQYVNQIAPKSIYVTGKGTTGAGLTATAEKDDFAEGGWTLKAGALVLAGGGIACIDEFDKMDKDDRSSMHEAMEQQSLTPDFELTLSDGSKQEIGSLVDGLMENSHSDTIKGIDCEILPLRKGNLRLLTTDFYKIFEVDVDRVSRHSAPNYFIEFMLQNGRSIKVTPEHPCWVVRNGETTTIPAGDVTEGEFFPIPEELPINGETQYFDFEPDKKRPNIKTIRLPKHNSPQLCRFLGYHLSDGSYESNRGIKNGINFWNSNHLLIEDYTTLVNGLFGVDPYIQRRDNREAVRITSISLVKWLEKIDPFLLENGKKKRIPPSIMKAESGDVAELLRALFEGDGGIVAVPRNGARIRFTTENQELAEQVQELLSRFTIKSGIFKEGSRSPVYRVDITGYENLRRYHQEIGFLSLEKKEKLRKYLKIKKTYRTQTDLVPNVRDRVLDIARSLNISLRKEFGYTHSRVVKNMQKRNLRLYVKLFRLRLGEIEQASKVVKESEDIGELISIRSKFRIPKTELAREIGVCRETIGNWEGSGINIESYRSALISVFDGMLSNKKSIEHLRRLAFGKVGWRRVKKIRKTENKDIKWVYDVTVEPTHTFISNNMVIHNTISVAKAGIVAKFLANTAILAASNPKFSRFDSYKPMAEQFDIPPTLISRFDLIFPIRDILDKERDSEVADHILKMHQTDKEQEDIKPDIDIELLRKYIAYARKNINPILTKDAVEKVRNFYVDLRGGSSETVQATPRQLEALVRLSEASAKIRLSEKVTVSDAERAIKLTSFVLREIAYDADTGLFDIDRVAAEHSKTARNKIHVVEDIIRSMVAESQEDMASHDEIIGEVTERGIDRSDAEKILGELKEKGVIYEPRHGRYMFTEGRE